VNRYAYFGASSPLYLPSIGQMYVRLFSYITRGKGTSEKKIMPRKKQIILNYSGNYTGMIIICLQSLQFESFIY
jgi:hypothetical protein